MATESCEVVRCAGRVAIWRNLGVDDLSAPAWRTTLADGGDARAVHAVVPADLVSRLQATATVEAR